jgi:hypothetical protein
MQTIKRYLVTVLIALLTVPGTLAQNPAQTQAQPPASQDVTIIIQQEKVRFTAQKAVEEMRLQIFDQTGQLVYDSGPIAEPELNWPLQDGNGGLIKSGLYAYTLSVKEAGAETSRVRRGHFIVDKAKDRDGNTDKLWVTSQNDNGIGTELTVARDESTTIAGATAPVRQEQKERSAAKRDGESNKDKRTEREALEVAGLGVPGQIAKFVSEEEVGSSEITEVEGSVGIGTPAPRAGYRLHVEGSTLINPGNGGEIGFGTPNAETGMSIIRGSGRADLRFDGSTFKFLAGPVGGPPSSNYGLSVNIAGKVGVGTTSMTASQLTIEGQNALTARGYEPFLNLQDSNDFLFKSSHRIQSAHGDLNFFYGYQPRSSGIALFPYTYVPRMIIKDTGNVGIGTIAPNHQLSLGRGPKWTTNGWGGSLELENATAIGWKANSAGQRFGMGHTNTGFYIFRTTSDPGTAVSAANYDLSISDTGVTSVRVLQILGGADFAENFDVSSAPSSDATTPQVDAGMVVTIDPLNPGKLALSTQSYDRRVAGIISGAGGVKPGMTMSQEGTLANGKLPVALSGRVYCWVDASQGAIEPGDLLTTSVTPGHAMKAGDTAKAQGAILGKAMTGLKEGKGLVLVLVTLQ